MKLLEKYAIENEKLIDFANYVVICLMDYDVEVVCNNGSDAYATWTFRVGADVFITFDKRDIDAVRLAYNTKDEFMLPSERKAYERFFSLCV